MTGELDLRIPAQEAAPDRRGFKALPLLMAAVLIGVIIIIVLQFTPPGSSSVRMDTVRLSAEKQKKLALKFESQGLDTAAAAAWKEYLASPRLDELEIAKIWYRIGKLHQKNNEYGEALASYYRSESFGEVASISAEMARRVQECLESMGKFAALRHELSDRVEFKHAPAGGVSHSPGDRVIAEIGSQKITLADLDRQIEQHIERQIFRVAPYLTGEQRNNQKEALLKQFSGAAQRRMLLNQLVLEEILVRRARELNLPSDPEVRALLKEQERGLLAGRLVEQAFAERIRITPADLKTYYEAHKDDYVSEGPPKTQKEFDAVKEDVFRALRSEKEKEVQQQLFSELKAHYDVVIHQSALAAGDPETGQPESK